MPGLWPTRPPAPAANSCRRPTPCAARDCSPTPLAPAKAARTFLAAAGLTGTVTITGGTTVTVDVRDTYDTTFLGIIGITSMTVTGHGQARITRSVGGVEQ